MISQLVPSLQYEQNLQSWGFCVPELRTQFQRSLRRCCCDFSDVSIETIVAVLTTEKITTRVFDGWGGTYNAYIDDREIYAPIYNHFYTEYFI